MVAHPAGQPGGDRAAAGADLETPPAAADADRLELPHGPRIERLCQGRQSHALHGAGVLEGVGHVITAIAPDGISCRSQAAGLTAAAGSFRPAAAWWRREPQTGRAVVVLVALVASLVAAAAAFGLPPFTTVPKSAPGSGGQAEVFGVATACHSTFDRFVIRARFGTPGYDVRYVRRIFEDGSGDPVPLQGSKRIRILIHDARGHTEAGGTSSRG